MSNAYKRASLLIQKAKGPKWKRELVSDHKFDFIDIEEFRDRTCLLTIRYFILLCSVLVSCAVYCADLGSAGILLIYNHWSLSTQPKIPFYISKWIYVGCIAISFMLLAWEIRKTRNVMETRDISLAVTNPLAYKTYSVKSYSHFCLLQKIKNSTKWSDVIIFYVFYTLKGWKKVIVAQGPRQIIAGITVYALLKSAWTDPTNGSFKFSSDWNTYGQDWPQRVSLMLMSFTCILWILSAIQIVLAVLLYFPILCQIQGNLKEYCCYKIDKRIDELLEKQRKKRIREREKYAHSVASKKSKKSKKGTGKSNTNDNELDVIPALPTLPVINNVDLYAGEKKSHPWLYQQPELQNSYYDSQPLTPLESTYSLQRNATKYNPYNETSYVTHQQSNMYTQQQKDVTTNKYYYPGTAQHNYSNFSTSNTVYNNANTAANNKPHEYDDIPRVANTTNNSNNNSYYYQPNSALNAGLYSNSNSQTKDQNVNSSNNNSYQQTQYNNALPNNGIQPIGNSSFMTTSPTNYQTNNASATNKKEVNLQHSNSNSSHAYYSSNNNSSSNIEDVAYEFQDHYYYDNDTTNKATAFSHPAVKENGDNNYQTSGDKQKQQQASYNNYI